MTRNKKVFVPSTSDIKILQTVKLLNERDLYPLPGGVFKILCGSGEDEYIEYRDMPTYATLLSYSSKHVSRLIMMLVRNHYLDKVYDEKTNELYLKLSVKGDMFLTQYSKKHKYSFIKKSTNKKPLIVKIENKK